MAYLNASARAVSSVVVLGLRVDKPAKALPAHDAATALRDLFHVKGGRVLVTGLLGEVTTVIGANVSNLSVTFTGDGTDQTVNDVASNVAGASAEAGTMIALNATVAGALVLRKTQGWTALGSGHVPLAFQAGVFKLEQSATNTGAVKWSIWYTPLDDGAYIEAQNL